MNLSALLHPQKNILRPELLFAVFPCDFPTHHPGGDPTADQMRELAACVRVRHLTPMYRTVIVPGLPWFQPRAGLTLANALIQVNASAALCVCALLCFFDPCGAFLVLPSLCSCCADCGCASQACGVLGQCALRHVPWPTHSSR